MRDPRGAPRENGNDQRAYCEQREQKKEQQCRNNALSGARNFPEKMFRLRRFACDAECINGSVLRTHPCSLNLYATGGNLRTRGWHVHQASGLARANFRWFAMTVSLRRRGQGRCSEAVKLL